MLTMAMLMTMLMTVMLMTMLTMAMLMTSLWRCTRSCQEASTFHTALAVNAYYNRWASNGLLVIIMIIMMRMTAMKLIMATSMMMTMIWMSMHECISGRDENTLASNSSCHISTYGAHKKSSGSHARIIFNDFWFFDFRLRTNALFLQNQLKSEGKGSGDVKESIGCCWHLLRLILFLQTYAHFITHTWPYL